MTRVLSERDAGETDDGAVDLIWINGANFAAMKEADLLFGLGHAVAELRAGRRRCRHHDRFRHAG